MRARGCSVDDVCQVPFKSGRKAGATKTSTRGGKGAVLRKNGGAGISGKTGRGNIHRGGAEDLGEGDPARPLGGRATGHRGTGRRRETRGNEGMGGGGARGRRS